MLLMELPIQLACQVGAIAVLGITALAMYKHWDKVMTVLTGDDSLHLTVGDAIWFVFFRCCGLCSGDWARNRFGQNIGVAVCTVELRSIIVGNLPVDPDVRADYYLDVDYSSYPAITTSLAENQRPTAVHFPETITLKLRSSVLEEPLKISVKQLHWFGSTTLCDIKVPAASVIEWAYPPVWQRLSAAEREKVYKRRMRMRSPQMEEHESPPWIYIEFHQPKVEHDLETNPPPESFVRTFEPASGNPYWPEYRAVNQSLEEFKVKLPLLDAHGHKLIEPKEYAVADVESRATCIDRGLRWLLIFGIAFWGGLGVVRLNTHLCWTGYRTISMAVLSGMDFPLSERQLRNITITCHLKVAGTGEPEGEDPCRPSEEQVLQMCKSRSEGGEYPRVQPRVVAQRIHVPFTGFTLTEPCPRVACDANIVLQKADWLLPEVCIGWVCLLVGWRMFGRQYVQAGRSSLADRSDSPSRANSPSWGSSRQLYSPS